MRALQGQIRSWALPQGAAAARLGITQPRVSNLMRGKVEKFSLDSLVELLPRAGLTPSIVVRRLSLCARGR